MAIGGKTTLVIDSDNSGLNRGLDQATAASKSFGKNLLKAAGFGSIGGAISSSVMSGISNIGGATGGAGATISKLLSGAIGGAVSGGMVAGPMGALVGGAAGAGAGAVHELVSGITDLTAKFSEQKKAAAQLGLSITSFQGLEYAAKRSGVEAESFTKSFGKLEKSIDEAKGKEGPQRAIFESLGISLEDLKSKSPEEIFYKLADGIQGTTDPSQRMVDAMTLMGKSGGEMIPMLAKGSAGIEKLRDKADELGITMTEAQQDTMQQYKDALNDLNDTWDGAKQQLVIELVPAIKKVIEAVTWLVKAFTKGDHSIRDWVADKIAQAGEAVGILPEGTRATLKEDVAREHKEQAQADAKAAQERAGKRKNERDKVAGRVSEESATGNIEAIQKAEGIIGKSAGDLFAEEAAALKKARQFSAITDDQMAQGLFNAGNKLIGSMGRMATQVPMMLKDSSAAAETILRSNTPQMDSGLQLRNAIELSKKVQEQHRDIGKQMLTELQKISGNSGEDSNVLGD